MNAHQTLAQADTVLEKIIHSLPIPEMESTNDVFFDVMSCVIEQQIHYRSTKKIFQKMLASAALETLTPQNFPILEEKAFPSAKIAIAKYETAKRVVEFWTANTINWQLVKDDEVREKLSSIKGIGAWTMDMILLYTLQRPTIFPADDFHLKQIMVNLYNLNPNARLKAQMMDIAAMWGDHTSLAVRYLLAWKENTQPSSQHFQKVTP
jgi:DNA-3-methyladenine glycosylase II